MSFSRVFFLHRKLFAHAAHLHDLGCDQGDIRDPGAKPDDKPHGCYQACPQLVLGNVICKQSTLLVLTALYHQQQLEGSVSMSSCPMMLCVCTTRVGQQR